MYTVGLAIGTDRHRLLRLIPAMLCRPRIQHMVFIKLKEGTPDDVLKGMCERCLAMRGGIPGLLSMEYVCACIANNSDGQ